MLHIQRAVILFSIRRILPRTPDVQFQGGISAQALTESDRRDFQARNGGPRVHDDPKRTEAMGGLADCGYQPVNGFLRQSLSSDYKQPDIAIAEFSHYWYCPQ
jgi:hypothetical protein